MSDTVFQIVIHALVLLIAFPVHEFAHGYVAHLLGDDTAKYNGRLTLNPLAHLDILGTIMMLLVGFGWAKPVPINPNNFKNRKVGMALSSLAGPVSNLIISYIAMILCKVVMYTTTLDGISYQVFLILYYMVVLNIGLAVFNLLPIPPLDGSRIFTLVLNEESYFKLMRYEQYIFIVLLVIMKAGILNTPLSYLRSGAFDVMDFLTGYVDLVFAR
jgi:Zn-dependent protease